MWSVGKQTPWRTKTQQVSLPRTASGNVLVKSHSLAVAAATGCSEKLRSLDHTWSTAGHQSCGVIWVRKLCKAGVQGNDVIPWPWLLQAQEKDGEGVKWDDTSTNMPVTGWCKGHNDGSQPLIVHFKGCRVVCYTVWCVGSSERSPAPRWDSYHQQKTVQSPVNERCILGKQMSICFI